MATTDVGASHSLNNKHTEELDTVVIRFCGDSGDGMQLVGTQFTNVSASFGNDVSTLPDFPAEIRAPAGSLSGVSGFQLHFSSHDIFTPGDEVDTLVAMNPAALKANIGELAPGGTLLVNAIYSRDYVLIQGVVLVVTVAFVLINTLVDLLYVVLDPRLRS